VARAADGAQKGRGFGRGVLAGDALHARQVAQVAALGSVEAPAAAHWADDGAVVRGSRGGGLQRVRGMKEGDDATSLMRKTVSYYSRDGETSFCSHLRWKMDIL
jgi:hypothetical protein